MALSILDPPRARGVDRRMIHLAILCILLGWAAPGSIGARDADPCDSPKCVRQLEKGRKALAQGKEKKALKVLEAADRFAAGRSPDVLVSLAMARFEMGDFDGAETDARKILSLTGNSTLQSAAHEQIGFAILFRERGKYYDERVSRWEKRGHTLIDISVNKEVLARNLVGARGAFEKALELSGGTSHHARYGLAETLAWMGHKKDARDLIGQYFHLGGDSELARQLFCWLDHEVDAFDATTWVDGPRDGDGDLGSETDFETPLLSRRKVPEYPARERRMGREGRVVLSTRGARASDDQPPATAGMMVTSSPSATGVVVPFIRRTSLSLI